MGCAVFKRTMSLKEQKEKHLRLITKQEIFFPCFLGYKPHHGPFSLIKNLAKAETMKII